MDLRALLRSNARNDLRRLIPTAHYWMRDHSPEADRDLVDPLLRAPMRFELTPREHAAAQALSDFATYEIRFRTIFANAFPVQDFDPSTPPTPSPGMTEEQEREIAARLEVFRRSALVYARLLADEQLMQGFHLPEAVRAPAAMPETTEERQQRRYRMCVEGGLQMPDNDYARLPRGVGRLAEKEGVTRPAFTADVKTHIARLAKQRKENGK
jgi:hypothetical protein